jgi:hypothetical protein
MGGRGSFQVSCVPGRFFSGEARDTAPESPEKAAR